MRRSRNSAERSMLSYTPVKSLQLTCLVGDPDPDVTFDPDLTCRGGGADNWKLGRGVAVGVPLYSSTRDHWE